jgi:hypothetical protein
MAKITLADGMVIEGTIEELKQMGVKFPVEEAEPLKVGDYVKVVAAESSVAKNGDIFKITHVNGVFPFEGQRIGDFAEEQFYDREIVRATDEEVAEAKAKLAEEENVAKWAKIGRKPNEFKEGDFVKYKKCFAEVTRVGIYDMSIEAPNGIIPVAFESAILITPGEARFDR